eukprot:scaffold86123_cov13-Prasinocladus_malaysianus.AAC.1
MQISICGEDDSGWGAARRRLLMFLLECDHALGTFTVGHSSEIHSKAKSSPAAKEWFWPS